MSSSGTPSPFLVTSEVYPPDEEQNRIRQSQIYQNIASAVNNRDISSYQLIEQTNGQRFFTPANNQAQRQGFRKVLQTGALVTGVNDIPHGITFPTPNTYHFTRIYGVIENTATPEYVPIPNLNVNVVVGDTNVTITIPVDYNGYSGIVVLEYLKTN